MKTCAVLLGVMVAFFTIFLIGNCSIYAHEPHAVGVEVLKFAKSGKVELGIQLDGDTSIKVKLFAIEDMAQNWILVVFPEMTRDPQIAGRPVNNLDKIIEGKGVSPEYNTGWEDPGPLWKVYTMKNAILIPPKGSASIDVYVDFLRRENGGISPKLYGKAYVVNYKDVNAMRKKPELLAQFVSGQQPAAVVIINSYYRIKGGKWFAGTFEEIFGRPSENELEGPLAGDYDQNSSQLPVVVNDYRSNLLLPGDFEDDGGKLFKQTLSDVLNLGSGEAGKEYCNKEEIQLYPDTGNFQSYSSSHTLSGKFSSKWASDHSLHPAFGWVVEAWTNENGSWQKLASDWVQSDGTWQLQIPSSLGYKGNHLRMYYRAYNSYFQPQDQNGNKYAWKGPDQNNIGANHYEGHWYADTDGGSANGLGDLYDGGYRMWSRLYWNGGINPVPSSPLKMYYPNTWYDCGDGSGNPWSCANTDGEIWFIAAHGTQAPVVSHELAHQLNNKFWDNKRPAGSGGSHTLTSCYPTKLGMALREGFADFMPGWVGYQDRNVAEAGFTSTQWNLGYDLESRNSPPNCANGWENELWVARTFWDLHDTHSDGDDILWFIHKGAVISLYLANGIANDGDAKDMRDYEDVYRNAATSGHEDFISDIFDQNRM